jgi:RNA polymerase sigma-70 factor (ECF subfamily)
MTESLLIRARTGDEDAFAKLTEPYRRELRFHCYRMLGSLEDAEDMLQETLLAAWRGLERFNGRSSLRAWLYVIATNRSLNSLRASGRRAPNPPDPPFPIPEPTHWVDSGWLAPYPDSLLEGIADAVPGPEASYETREGIELAFVAALQELPPRQRAALVLRDVLGFHTTEVADMLRSSEASIKSALQRARRTLEQRHAPSPEQAPPPNSPRERELVRRFVDAWEADDIDGVVTLLTEDAWLTMPPAPHAYRGHAAIAAFLRASADHRPTRRVKLIPTRANTQPAFALYIEDPAAPIGRAAGLIVLTLASDQITAITRFLDAGLLRPFGLPRMLRDWPGVGVDQQRQPRAPATTGQGPRSRRDGRRGRAR